MENAHFSHFGVKDENQPAKKRIEPRKQAKIDGYLIGDRVLEGVVFILTIQEDGSISAEVEPKHSDYFYQLNTEMWLDRVVEAAKNQEMFNGLDGVRDISLIMDDGRYNFEWHYESR